MKRDYITITKKDGSKEQMEVVSTFTLEENQKDYIIYKSIGDDEHYYAASYDENSNLNTDLSDSEKEKLNKILDDIIKESGNNVGV
ncbi:MAG: hypothetical protein K2I70_01945 [Bacilli bacterium]|nr:hypothetical protein [Bacilli bacterium]